MDERGNEQSVTHTLQHLMGKVPHLLTTCLNDSWDTTNRGIQILRLVSKELKTVALNAATSVSFKLSGNPVPRIYDILKHCALRHLKITLGPGDLPGKTSKIGHRLFIIDLIGGTHNCASNNLQQPKE